MIIDNTKLFQEIEQKLPQAQELMNQEAVKEMFIKDFAVRFCWSSNAIEGNTLSLDETIELIEYDEVSAGKPYSHYQAAKYLYTAIENSLLPFHKQQITKEWIKRNNAIVSGAMGDYRTKEVYVGTVLEKTYIPPLPEKVPGLMKQFLQNINFNAENLSELIEKIAKAHIDFEMIHPFEDGNGRVGRMILNQHLINHGLLPVTIGPAGDYRRSFALYEKKGDMSKMVHELCKEELKSIERINEMALKLQHPDLNNQISTAEGMRKEIGTSDRTPIMENER